MMTPFKISTFTNSITIGWEEPASNGGCPLTGYAVYRDDGLGGDVTTEVNEVDDPLITGNPTLRQATITDFPADFEGVVFRFKVRAYNREDYVDSPFVRILNAGPPDDLTDAVVLVKQTDSYLQVTMPLIDQANVGNSDIISYNLQMDDGHGGDFYSIAGEDSLSMQT